MVKKKVKRIKKVTKTMSETRELKPWKFGCALGKVFALMVLIISLVGVYGWLGGFPVWNSLIADMYGSLGYSLSFIGILLGMIYAFIDGLLIGALFVCIYNRKCYCKMCK